MLSIKIESKIIIQKKNRIIGINIFQSNDTTGDYIQIADLHIHSKYSRATSPSTDIKTLAAGAHIKGIDILGTGDFTHPLWFDELRNTLVDADGIYEYDNIKFIPSTEVSLIYRKDGKTRKIHHVILAPDLDIVAQINEYFKRHGRVDYDGRPIFGIPSEEVVYNLRQISDQIEVIPAHAWTPWFGIFGSMSGFDSLQECFGDQTKYIHAIETGLSSSPAMNWRIPELDTITLVSNSDAHSAEPWRIGREANMFDLKHVDYKHVIEAIRTRKNFLGTIEVDPAYGKYHFDGHRNCNIVLDPQESNKKKNICPKCGTMLTIGVLHRIEELAQRPEGFVLPDAAPFKKIIPFRKRLIIIGYISRHFP
ncbi:MAG: hypothetical protein HY832_00065, partial [Candidatus Aenigmarchaeota archaeon]|nr:hypothetical protein [Candidatus Aenigmarchaeota archaeon]